MQLLRTMMAALAVLLPLACAGAAVEEDDLRFSGDADAELAEAADEARARAHELPESAEHQVAASAALFRRIESRLAAASALRVEHQDPPSVASLIALEDELEGDLAREVASLAAQGKALAERALELKPEDAAASHYFALHRLLELQTMSKARALFQVKGAVRAMERTIELDPAYDGGAPLLLLGRFRDRAPWPHQDREEAVELIDRAVELRPDSVRWLYLGDALFGLGDRYDEAIAAWSSAVTAEEFAGLEMKRFTQAYRLRAEERLTLELGAEAAERLSSR